MTTAQINDPSTTPKIVFGFRALIPPVGPALITLAGSELFKKAKQAIYRREAETRLILAGVDPDDIDETLDFHQSMCDDFWKRLPREFSEHFPKHRAEILKLFEREG